MYLQKPKRRRRHRAAALVLTMVFVALFACMAVAIAAAADINLTVARNRYAANQAAALAEAGLMLAQTSLSGLNVTEGDPAGLHQEIATHLASTLQGSSMRDLSSALIAGAEDSVTVPPLQILRGDGLAGTVNLSISSDGGADDDPTITVTSTGHFEGASRTVTYTLTVDGGSSIFAHQGVATKSQVRLTGLAVIAGVNDPKEGSVLSSTSQDPAVRIWGISYISGDVMATDPDNRIQSHGWNNIGGQTIIGAEEPEWPEVDTQRFEQYVESTLSGPTNGNRTFTNIRIPAGANPTFSGNTRLNGVIYIESPNRVTFAGNTQMTGVIVMEPPSGGVSDDRIWFVGNSNSASVENLPNESRYDGLRDETGTFILAPGADVEFTGNMRTLSGAIVSRSFAMTGIATGTIRGGLLNTEDTLVRMTGISALLIDMANADDSPAGLVSPRRIVCVEGTYGE